MAEATTTTPHTAWQPSQVAERAALRFWHAAGAASASVSVSASVSASASQPHVMIALCVGVGLCVYPCLCLSLCVCAPEVCVSHVVRATVQKKKLIKFLCSMCAIFTLKSFEPLLNNRGAGAEGGEAAKRVARLV